MILFLMITRLSAVMEDVVKNLRLPKRTRNANLFRNEPTGMPPLPVYVV